MRHVTIIVESILDGRRETIRGYRVRSDKQLRSLERKLSRVYATYNQRIVEIK
jgi:hypothetical protein